ncbi:hypothetical protein NDU88_011446 [Pleurodeles waltl]|uniref:Uncharacterized protein n=1 Tax=Pleurodeles waltl TaxID=8319 RepID=A0AAV7QX98_PLEWA|nr:hypothetical protein NDU88_011446 [Pleurodeles waltl]
MCQRDPTPSQESDTVPSPAATEAGHEHQQQGQGGVTRRHSPVKLTGAPNIRAPQLNRSEGRRKGSVPGLIRPDQRRHCDARETSPTLSYGWGELFQTSRTRPPTTWGGLLYPMRTRPETTWGA